jgi:hypothetical protein
VPLPLETGSVTPTPFEPLESGTAAQSTYNTLLSYYDGNGGIRGLTPVYTQNARQEPIMDTIRSLDETDFISRNGNYEIASMHSFSALRSPVKRFYLYLNVYTTPNKEIIPLHSVTPFHSAKILSKFSIVHSSSSAGPLIHSSSISSSSFL